jgi:hypothetical protein
MIQGSKSAAARKPLNLLDFSSSLATGPGQGLIQFERLLRFLVISYESCHTLVGSQNRNPLSRSLSRTTTIP